MRVWDVNPGYLNRQSLLAEHREIHAVFVVITAGKKGYSRHPETLRWYDKLAALKQRHDLLVVPPPQGRLLNAIQHMWGYVSPFVSLPEPGTDLQRIMDTIRRVSFTHKIDYLLQSTALSDLAVYTSKGIKG